MKLTNYQALQIKNTPLEQLVEEEQVKNYLLNHPDFLQKNPQLLSLIELNHQNDGATSLVERQVKSLRDENNQLQQDLINILNIARNNEKLLKQYNQFVLGVISTNNLASLASYIIDSLISNFSLDAATLILVGNDISDVNLGSAKLVTESSEIRQLLSHQFPDESPICGRLEERSKKQLFAEQAQQLQSFCIVPLGKQCKFGVLVLASKDESGFEPEMDTLFVEQIAELIVHATRRHSTDRYVAK